MKSFNKTILMIISIFCILFCISARSYGQDLTPKQKAEQMVQVDRIIEKEIRMLENEFGDDFKHAQGLHKDMTSVEEKLLYFRTLQNQREYLHETRARRLESQEEQMDQVDHIIENKIRMLKNEFGDDFKHAQGLHKDMTSVEEKLLYLRTLQNEGRYLEEIRDEREAKKPSPNDSTIKQKVTQYREIMELRKEALKDAFVGKPKLTRKNYENLTPLQQKWFEQNCENQKYALQNAYADAVFLMDLSYENMTSEQRAKQKKVIERQKKALKKAFIVDPELIEKDYKDLTARQKDKFHKMIKKQKKVIEDTYGEIKAEKKPLYSSPAEAAAAQKRMAQERQRAYQENFGDMSEITQGISQVISGAARSLGSSGQDSYHQKPATAPSYEGELPYMEKDPYGKYRKGFKDIQKKEAQKKPQQKGRVTDDCPGGLNIMGICEEDASSGEITDYWPAAEE